MTLYAPLWLQAPSGGTPVQYAASLDRTLIDTIFTTNGVIKGSTPPVPGQGDLAVTVSGSSLSVNVAPGRAIINSELSGGKYLVWSDATVNVPLAAAPGTGLLRYDLIVALVNDSLVDSSGSDDFVIQAITGTASGSPVVPTCPFNAIGLAVVAVGAGATVPTFFTEQRVVTTVLASARWSPVGRIYLNGASLTVSGSPQALTMNQVDYLFNGMAAASGGLVIPVNGGGVYDFKGQIEVASASSGNQFVEAYLMQNGGVYSNGTRNISTNQIELSAQVADEILCAPGDVIQLGYRVQQAGAVATAGAGQVNYLAGHLVAQ